MSRARLTAFVFWLGLGFVTWNVVYDRQLAVAGAAFTREQTLNHQQGRPVRTIDDAFRPEVRAAAWRASGWAGIVVAVGAVVSAVSGRGAAGTRSGMPSGGR